MSRTIPHLLAKGTKVVDLTEKSWHRNAKSIAAVVKRIQEANIDALTVLVHDLFGNTSVHFCQADDTLSLAVKLPREGGVAPYGGRRFTPNSLWKTVQIFTFLQFCVTFLGGAVQTSHTRQTHVATHTLHKLWTSIQGNKQHTIIIMTSAMRNGGGGGRRCGVM